MLGLSPSQLQLARGQRVRMQSTNGACREDLCSGTSWTVSFARESMSTELPVMAMSNIYSSGVHSGGTETLTFVSLGLCTGTLVPDETELPLGTDFAIPLK
nr:hypothetical protein Iba_chr01fCG6790 [Ipomoea batatas]